MIEKKKGYVAPPRTAIVDAVSKLVPRADRGVLETLDFSMLYALHSDTLCYGLDVEACAEDYIPGYTSDRDVKALRQKNRAFRQALKKQVKEQERKKKMEARAKMQAARAKARAAREKARAKARAARDRARA